MIKLIECIPNISVGRDLRTIEKLANVIRAEAEVQLLDVHWDVDHNRSVYTFLGTPEGVQRAAFALTEEAVRLIDISQHEGVHPFMGAMDVIPFVPVKNVTIEDCVTLAQTVGGDIEKHLHVPVYFYGEATSDPKARNLADLRAQSYNLKKHRTAGAVAIGVRDYLVAYNVNLDTIKLDIAKQMAAKLREKNGGLAGVQALGLSLKSKKQVQVSMNLVDTKKARTELVEKEIRDLAKKLKVKIAGTELVGLMPEQVKKAAEVFI
jgi:glutamate formiminotransferase